MGSTEVSAMASEPDPESTARPLHVCIAGAGIGGLSAAIALRQAGHRVVVCPLFSPRCAYDDENLTGYSYMNPPDLQ